MKYKVGDKVRIVSDTNSHGFMVGQIVTIEKVDHRYYEIANYYVPEQDVELHEAAPDYRAMYEQEKELREAAEALITHIQKYYKLEYSVHEGAFNNYQQLKQQYNGQDTGTAL